MLKGKKKVATWQEETVSILQVEIKPSSPLFIQYLVVGKSGGISNQALAPAQRLHAARKS